MQVFKDNINKKIVKCKKKLFYAVADFPVTGIVITGFPIVEVYALPGFVLYSPRFVVLNAVHEPCICPRVNNTGLYQSCTLVWLSRRHPCTRSGRDIVYNFWNRQYRFRYMRYQTNMRQRLSNSCNFKNLQKNRNYIKIIKERSHSIKHEV